MLSTFIDKYWNYFKFAPEEKRRVNYHVLFAVVLALAVDFYLYPSAAIQEMCNETFDMYIRGKAKIFYSYDILYNPAPPKEWNQFVFFDLDSQSLKDLNRPTYVPRGIIAAMVRHAAQNGAKIIIVDFEFSDSYPSLYKYDTDSEREREISYMEKVGGRNGDELLVTTLQEIGTGDSNGTSENSAKILLTRTRYTDDDLKRLFWGEKLNGCRNIYWASPYFIYQGEDHTVREFSVYYKNEYKIEDKEDSHEKTHFDQENWSLGAVAAALQHAQSRAELDKQLQEYRRIKNRRLRFFFNPKGDEQPYIFHWRREKPLPDSATCAARQLDTNDKDFGYMVFPKDDAREQNQEKPYKGKTVIIGRSDEDSGDFHSSVLDDKVPGIYLHGNSIATIQARNSPSALSDCTRRVLDIALIVILSVPLARLGKRAIIVFIPVPLVLLFICFLWFLFTDIFVFIGIPVFILGLIETIWDILEIKEYLLHA